MGKVVVALCLGILLFLKTFPEGCRSAKKGQEQQTSSRKAPATTLTMPQKEGETAEVSFFSPRTKILIESIHREKGDKSWDEYVPSEKLIEEYSLRSIDNRYYAKVFLVVSQEGTEELEQQLNEMGVRVQTRAGNIWTALVPLSELTALEKLKGKIKQVDTGAKAYPRENQRTN